MFDAWGKMPSGMLVGGFTWPGNMRECESTEGNRTLVLDNGETVVVGAETIKGAWSLVSMKEMVWNIHVLSHQRQTFEKINSAMRCYLLLHNEGLTLQVICMCCIWNIKCHSCES